jgi:hypothetical protein
LDPVLREHYERYAAKAPAFYNYSDWMYYSTYFEVKGMRDDLEIWSNIDTALVFQNSDRLN